MSFFAITAHGMNLHPERMGEIEELLKSWGGITHNIIFRGHEEGKVHDYNQARAQDWMNDLESAMEVYKKNHLGLPIFFVGYSLGGLVGASYLQRSDDFRKYLKKSVYIAPAIAPRSYLTFVARTTGFPDWKMPSLNIKNYGVHKWTSVRVNNEIYRLIKELNPPRDSHALVFLNKYDELISFKKTQEFIQEKGLKNWIMKEIRPERKQLRPMPQHLFVDSKTMGPKTWSEFKKAVYDFIRE